MKRHDSERSPVRRSKGPTSPTDEGLAITPLDVISRLEIAAILRDRLVTALGRVLLLCLEDDARVPFELIHDVVRTRHVAAYDLLQVLPILRDKTPLQQLYKLLQMLERVGSRFVSEYALLCMNVFPKIDMERVSLDNILTDMDNATLEAISLDESRSGKVPLFLQSAMNLLLRAVRNDSALLNLHTVSAILLNHPSFDLTDPEVPGAIRFVALRMKERSRPADPLLEYVDSSLDDVENLLRTILERLEVDEQSPDVMREACSLLLQNLGGKSYPDDPAWKDEPRKILTMITTDRYPLDVVIVAKSVADHLDDPLIRSLDIGFYESGEHAVLQVLSRLLRHSQHLAKPLSLLKTFVSQRLMNEAAHEYAIPMDFYEVDDYLHTFESPCLKQEVYKAMQTLRPLLTQDLPWTYAFGDRRVSEDPRELVLTSLVRLRNLPMSRAMARAIDDVVYKSRVHVVTGRQRQIYDYGVIFQRDDSTNVEVDLFSLLMRIPNVFRSENFAPMLNFLSKPNVLELLGREFNKFQYETPRSLLLAILKRALALSLVKSNESLFKVVSNAQHYLEEPLLVNLYTTEDLQQLLKSLPGIDSDPRYLPLKVLFKKRKLLAYLAPTFSLAGMKSPTEILSLVLKTVSLKSTQPKLMEALDFALDNFDGSPLPPRALDHSDFVYLVRQLLSRNKSLRNEILNSPAYVHINDWNVSISGSPEAVLARMLSYPVNQIAANPHLAYVAKRAESIISDKGIDVDVLSERTLDTMLEYLPDSTYTKPVSLLLRKANLMMLVPQAQANLDLRRGDIRDMLVKLLKALTQAPVIRAEKSLLRRVKTVLASLDGVAGKSTNRQTPILAYLTLSLQDPSNAVYKPLLSNLKTQNATIPPDERQVWLENYLRQIVNGSSSEKLTKAAITALGELVSDEELNEEARVSKTRIEEAVSLLPIDSFTAPLRKLLTPDWVYGILPNNTKESLESEGLLLEILRRVKERADIADNPALLRTIFKVEMNLNGWMTNTKSLSTVVAVAKNAVYDPVKNLLTVAGLNKIQVTVRAGKSTRATLLNLLRTLLSHTVIQQNSKLSKLLSIVKQDVVTFGADVDLLTVLDEVGIGYTNELAPIRLFLHRKDIGEKIGRTILAIANPEKRYRALLKVLQHQRDEMHDTRFLDALSALKNSSISAAPINVSLSDLTDIVDTIPRHVRQRYKSIEHLFNRDILSRLTYDNEIMESENPLSTLLSSMAGLPEIRGNFTAMSKLQAMTSEIERLHVRPTVTKAQLKPLLMELDHVRQINVDFLNHILQPEVLGSLNLDDLMSFDNDTEMLRFIVDYLLNDEAAYADVNMRRHLMSLKRALMLTIGDGATTSKHQLTDDDWKMILSLVPNNKTFRAVKIFLQSNDFLAYIPKNTNWKLYSTPTKKLLYLLSLIENNEVENRNVHRSARKLREIFDERFNFVTEEDVKNMHRTLASLNLKYDLVPLKIFLNHDNMIRYLPSHFKYAKDSSPTHAFIAVLDELLQVPSLKQRVNLYEAMVLTRQALIEQSQSRRFLSSTKSVDHISVEDLKFVSLFKMSSPKLRKFMDPQTLLNLLPKSFSFLDRPTFKTKALHLLRQLLQTNTDVQHELKELFREVEEYPDVPIITKDDLAPILEMIPVQGIPRVTLVKEYLKPSVLVRLLPGTFDPKKTSNIRTTLHNILLLLDVTLGSKKTDKVQMVIDVLLNKLTESTSSEIREEAAVDRNDVQSIIWEIPFKQHKQIKQLEAQMTTNTVIAALPMNFQLTKYKTKKLRLLAILDELAKSKNFRSSADSIKFARSIVHKMPDMPKITDAEIKGLLLRLSLSDFYVKHLASNCRLNTLAGYLPIHFDLSAYETRKQKIGKILEFCKLAKPASVRTKQALANARAQLGRLPDFDVTAEHVQALIKSIPCTHFSMIKPLLRYLAEVDVAPLLSLDMYRPTTFKQRLFDLLAALRNTYEMQNNTIFAALDALESNVHSMPEQVQLPNWFINRMKSAEWMNTNECVTFRDFVLTVENLAKILPPNYSFAWRQRLLQNEWSLIAYFSKLFLREVRVNGPVKSAFEATVNGLHNQARTQLVNGITMALRNEPFTQLVPLRLYTRGHASNFFAPIEDMYRDYFHGSYAAIIRVALMELTRRPGVIKSESLVKDIQVFLHDYVFLRLTDSPSVYEMRLAINEIPNEDKYDDLRLLMECPEIQIPVEHRLMPGDGTSKQLLYSMLELAEKALANRKIRHIIASLKPTLMRDIREEEAELMLKQMRNYRYHANKTKPIKSYIVSEGLNAIMPDYRVKYPTFKERLVALNNALQATASANKTSKLREASDYLKMVLNNEVKIQHVMSHTIDDVNVQSLLLALPRTRDERIVRGIIKFFSTPNLLRELGLPKNPFNYVTKGQLLQAIVDLGQGLQTVRKDPLQQEALEYFADKIPKTGLAAQRIKLKKDVANLNVDMYGVMRAVDYSKADEAGAVQVAMFFENKYDHLVHTFGFDHSAYATRGAYLTALFKHLVYISDVPDDVKQRISALTPLVRLDGPGSEIVDLNNDVALAVRNLIRSPIEQTSNHSNRNNGSQSSELSTTKLPILKEKESLKTAVDDMLGTARSTEGDENSNDSRNSIHHEEIHIAVSENNVSRNAIGEVIRQKSTIKSKRTSKHYIQHPVSSAMNDSDWSFEKSGANETPNVANYSSKVSAENHTEATKKNDRSTEEEPLSNDSVSKDQLEEAAGDDERSRAKSRETTSSEISYINVEIDDSNMSDKRIVKPLPVTLQELPSEQPPLKVYGLHQKSHNSTNRRLLIRPDSTNIEFEDNSEDTNVAPDFRMFQDTLQKYEKNLSCTEELIAENVSNNSSRTVKKDLSRKQEKELKDARKKRKSGRRKRSFI